MQVEKDAADILLDRRRRLPIAAPFFLKWFGKKEISLWVKSNKAGTSLRVSSYYAGLGVSQEFLDNITVDAALKLHAYKGVAVSKMIACAIINSYAWHYLLTPLLAFYIRWNCDQLYQVATVNWLLLSGDTQHFITTIRRAHQMTVTAPTLSQQMTEGS